MAVSKRLRYEILRRDNHACRYCGACAPDVKLTVDHVRPVTLGGSDDPSNLVAACGACNSGKTSSNPDQPLVDDVSADALRWGRAMQHAAAQRVADREALDGIVAHFDHLWAEWWVGSQDCPLEERRPIPRDPNWPSSIRRFAEAGLEMKTLKALLSDAMECDVVKAQYTWRSFCRRCWDEITARQELARQLVAESDTVPASSASIWDSHPWDPLCTAALAHYPGLESEGRAPHGSANVADQAIHHFRRGLDTRAHGGYPTDLPAWVVRLIQRDIEDTATIAQALAAVVPETNFALDDSSYPGVGLGRLIAAYALCRLGIEAPDVAEAGTT